MLIGWLGITRMSLPHGYQSWQQGKLTIYTKLWSLKGLCLARLSSSLGRQAITRIFSLRNLTLAKYFLVNDKLPKMPACWWILQYSPNFFEHWVETEDFSCHALSTNLSLCILLLSFPNVEIRVYFQMGDTWIYIWEGRNMTMFQWMWQV